MTAVAGFFGMVKPGFCGPQQVSFIGMVEAGFFRIVDFPGAVEAG